MNYAKIRAIRRYRMRMKATFRRSFSLRDADPKPSEGGWCGISGRIAPGERGKIRLTGNMSGVPNETKTVKVEFGTFQGQHVSFRTVMPSE